MWSFPCNGSLGNLSLSNCLLSQEVKLPVDVLFFFNMMVHFWSYSCVLVIDQAKRLSGADPTLLSGARGGEVHRAVPCPLNESASCDSCQHLSQGILSRVVAAAFPTD